MDQVGTRLRAERERQGLTVEQVAESTKIRSKYIEAIEANAYQLIPAEVYLKGFIRSYAKLLGLDGEALVQAYKQGPAPAQAVEQQAVEQQAAAAAPAPPEPAPRPTRRQAQPAAHAAPAPLRPTPRPTRRPAQPAAPATAAPAGRRGVALLAGGVVVLALVAGGLWALRGNGAAPTGAVPSAATGPVTEPAPPPQATTPPPDTPKPKDPPPVPTVSVERGAVQTKAGGHLLAPVVVKGADGLVLKAHTHDRCWLQVDADGKTVFSGIMAAGSSQEWHATNRMQVQVGAPPALAVDINGKSWDPLYNDSPMDLDVTLQK